MRQVRCAAVVKGMLLVVLVLAPLAATAMLGARRLSPYGAGTAYILAEGAPTKGRGKTFSETFGAYEDAREDLTGRGTKLLEMVPAYLRDTAVPVKVTGGPAALRKAVEWIDSRCAGRECIVYSAFGDVHGKFMTVVP